VLWLPERPRRGLDGFRGLDQTNPKTAALMFCSCCPTGNPPRGSREVRCDPERYSRRACHVGSSGEVARGVGLLLLACRCLMYYDRVEDQRVPFRSDLRAVAVAAFITISEAFFRHLAAWTCRRKPNMR